MIRQTHTQGDPSVFPGNATRTLHTYSKTILLFKTKSLACKRQERARERQIEGWNQVTIWLWGLECSIVHTRSSRMAMKKKAYQSKWPATSEIQFNKSFPLFFFLISEKHDIWKKWCVLVCWLTQIFAKIQLDEKPHTLIAQSCIRALSLSRSITSSSFYSSSCLIHKYLGYTDRTGSNAKHRVTTVLFYLYIYKYIYIQQNIRSLPLPSFLASFETQSEILERERV